MALNSPHNHTKYDRRGGWGRDGKRPGGWNNYNDKNNSRFKRPAVKKALEGVDMNTPVMKIFAQHARDLDEKNDRYERIVKISRDVTVESKRVIFLLHRITSPDDKPTILCEAEGKLSYIRQRLWKRLAFELKGQDPFKFLRAYTGGLQEYVEAISFYHYNLHGTLITCDEVQKQLTFEITQKAKKTPRNEDDIQIENDKEKDDKAEDVIKDKENSLEDEKDGLECKKDILEGNKNDENGPENCTKDSTEENSTEPKESAEKPGVSEILIVFVPQTDFILGLADLTGEVMRQAINMVSCGEIEICFELLKFLNDLHLAFLDADKLGNSREMSKKINVLKQSLKKVENACYNLNVKGSQVPNHLLASYFHSKEDYHPENVAEE